MEEAQHPSGERDTHLDIPLSSHPSLSTTPPTVIGAAPRPYGTRTQAVAPFANPESPLFGSPHFFLKETVPDYGCGLHSAVMHTAKIVFFRPVCSVTSDLIARA